MRTVTVRRSSFFERRATAPCCVSISERYDEAVDLILEFEAGDLHPNVGAIVCIRHPVQHNLRL